MREPKKFVYKGNKYEKKKDFYPNNLLQGNTVNGITETVNIIYFST